MSEPLVPVTGTVKLPDDEAVQAKILADDPPAGTLTLVGSVHVMLAGAVKERFTVPENVFKLEAVSVELPERLAELTGLGEAVKLKSTKWNGTLVVVCDSEPSVPVTVTV